MRSLGIYSKTYASAGLAPIARTVSELGFDGIHLSMASAGLAALPDAIPPGTIESVARALHDAGLTPLGLSATFNVTDPDNDRLKRGLRAAGAIIDAAAELGAPLVSLCSGTLDRDDMWAFHPGNGSDAAWDAMCHVLLPLGQRAAAAGVLLGIEPEHNNVISDAASARRFLDLAHGLPFAVILDPANLVDPSMSAETQAVVLSDALELLHEHIAVIHVKDKSTADTPVPPGEGTVNHRCVAEQLTHYDLLEVPLVTHEIGPADAARALAFMRRTFEPKEHP